MLFAINYCFISTLFRRLFAVVVRILAKHLTITRFSRAVARYTMIKHHADVGNPSSPVRC